MCRPGSALSTFSGFACGEDDGYFGPHTEAALQQFQENVGLFADGMAFQDTYAYINRLHHVLEGKPSVTEAESVSCSARAANVLERFQIAVIGEDPIARSVASRMWNIATATTDNSGMMLCYSEVPTDVVLGSRLKRRAAAGAAPRAIIRPRRVSQPGTAHPHRQCRRATKTGLASALSSRA